MRRRVWLMLFACLLLALSSARAATVIRPKAEGDSLADRAAAARTAMEALPVGHYGMTPVYGAGVADGDYEVSLATSSPYFRAVSATLSARGGALTLTFVIGSDSYARVCRAAAADAEAAEWIEGEAVGDGTRFTVPVPALNMPFELAAYSRARGKWYDRWLLVDAASLPEGALGFELPDYALIEAALEAYAPDAGDDPADRTEAAVPEPVPVDLPDGEYAIEVGLTGGSGRASVSSPTLLIVREGRAWARLLWSSPYYDYMLLSGARYDNLTADGGSSRFEIPVTAMDAPLRVIADTTAMGDPVEIEYALTFYAESIGDRRQVPQEAARQVLLISLAIIALGGALNGFIKRRRR